VTPVRKLEAAVIAAITAIALEPSAHANPGGLGAYASRTSIGRSVVLKTDAGQSVRFTPYGESIVRVQVVEENETFAADDLYEMVQSHAWSGAFQIAEDNASLRLSTATGVGVEVRIAKNPLRLSFADASRNTVVLADETARGIRTGARPLEVRVNGAVARAAFAFPRTSRWETWNTVELNVALVAGTNAVHVAAIGENGPNLDELTVLPGASVYQAEDAVLLGAKVGADHAGYRGRGFADFTNAAGDSIQWQITVPATGTYTLQFRYANASPALISFENSPSEHFSGLGHGAFGRVDKLDLKGQVITRQRENQAPLLVPFFFSSRRYGVFVNSTYPTEFSFTDSDYHIKQTSGPLDYFVFIGKNLVSVLDLYTALTGRPRMPPIAAFGLGLSDKASQTGGDGQGTLPSSAIWWEDKIDKMRAGGLPYDVVIHDNSWRGAKTGPWEWDRSRYPDPVAFAELCKARGVVNMLDFNRADAAYSEGWKPEFKIPGTADAGDKAGWLDATRPDVRAWFWSLLYTKAYDPKLRYPADFLWIDEPDETVVPSGPLGNGRTWDEMGGYYFFLLAKAVVGEGWDVAMNGRKRPFVMSRGMTAGAQRWATLWSGDIATSYDEMKLQIRGMLAAGVSGFPYWAHDAGGFSSNEGPSIAMYRKWALAMGSFSPIWRPHGPGFRFPWGKYESAAEEMRRYGNLRMALLPYLYTYAREAHDTGAPIARPLFLDSPDESEAWSRDLEYAWGREMIVAPDTSENDNEISVWLPKGTWFEYFTDAQTMGPVVLQQATAPGRMPIFVRAGAILPGALPMASTQFWDHGTLVVDVYAGANGNFELIEDDGVTEDFSNDRTRRTKLEYADDARSLTVDAARGTFANAPATRRYRAHFHGLQAPFAIAANGETLPNVADETAAFANGDGVVWEATRKVLTVVTRAHPVASRVVLRASYDAPPSISPGTTNPPSDAGNAGTPTSPPPSGGCGCVVGARRENRTDGAAWLGATATLLLARRRKRFHHGKSASEVRYRECINAPSSQRP
jgi:alpha-D-xyloside xylohydrolase